MADVVGGRGWRVGPRAYCGWCCAVDLHTTRYAAAVSGQMLRSVQEAVIARFPIFKA